MKATAVSLLALFETKMQLEVPLFQPLISESAPNPSYLDSKYHVQNKRKIFNFLFINQLLRKFQCHATLKNHGMVSSAVHGISEDSTIRHAIKKQCLAVLCVASRCQTKKQKSQ
ncbi:MAG: hypothetical protein PHZ14_02005 [Sulfuricella sp.]|jgi:hypothetical protein|nr:hypothetical protein [Sulfuricella sp.]